jgi:hypothetical protein
MTWLATLLGTILIALTVRDIFHTLWHPRGMGGLARRLFVVTWRLLRRMPMTRSSELSGPLALVLTAAAWTGGLVLGFALIYLPPTPEGFAYGTALSPAETPLWTSLYLSLVTVATLGFGDVTPITPWLRVVVPFQALLGFLLFTAIITWVLQLYPALSRRRALARRLASMQVSDTAETLPTAEVSVVVQLLEDVRAELAGTEIDLAQYGESYFFREVEADLSLAAQLPYVQDLVSSAGRSTAPEVRDAGVRLQHGLDRLSDLLRREFLRRLDPGADTASVLAGYTADHRHRAAPTGK